MMTKAIVPVLAVAFLLVPPRTSMAGDKEWATAGKIMVGLAGLAIVSDLIADERPAYCPVTQPRRIIRVRVPDRVWVPAREVRVTRTVWVAGYFEKVWVPPVRERRGVAKRFGGRREETVVRPGFYKNVWHPGHFETRTETRWVPAHWEGV